MKCDWCKKSCDSTVKHKDATGREFNICKECDSKISTGHCIQCGSPVDSSMEIEGLCPKCIQVKMKKQLKKKQAVMMDAGADLISASLDDCMTEEQYEQWLMFSPTGMFNPDSMKNSSEHRMLWITLKLLTAGIPEEEHHKYVKDIEDILDTYFSELVGTKCSIIIVTDSKSRAKVRQSDVIGHRNNCYIIKRRETPKDGK